MLRNYFCGKVSKMSFFSKNLSVFSSLLVIISGCITFNAEEEMRESIFKMQTRLLSIEKSLSKDNAGISARADQARQGVASVSSKISGVEREIQTLAGQIDLFKHALEKGEMPGAMQSEESLFSRLTGIEERVAQIEDTQKDILEMVEVLDNKNKKPGGSKGLKNEKKISTMAQARDAFKKRRYAYLRRDVPMLKAKVTKRSSRQELSFLYAESLYKLGSLEDAAIEFHEFLDSKPSKKYLPHAKMRMGDCYRHLGKSEAAEIYYEELMSEFPRTEESKWAKERLDKMAKRN